MTQAVATTAPRPQITAGAQVAALVPQTLDEAFRVAQAIAASGMAPRGMEKPEQIMVAIMAGAELGFAPFQSLQSFAVVNGRPTLWGDGLVAVIRRNGCSIREWHEGDTAYCEVTRPDTGETITRSFSQADAFKAGLAGKTGPWQQYPQRMRAMRARAWAGRDGCADMLRGFQIVEEVADYTDTVRDVTPKTTGMRARLEARTAAAEGFDPAHVARETGGEAETVQHDAGGVVDEPAAEDIHDAVIEDAPPADDAPATEPKKPTKVRIGTVELPTLADHVTAFKTACQGKGTTALSNIWRSDNVKGLLAALEAADPDVAGETPETLELWFNDTFTAQEDVEKGGAQ